MKNKLFVLLLLSHPVGATSHGTLFETIHETVAATGAPRTLLPVQIVSTIGLLGGILGVAAASSLLTCFATNVPLKSVPLSPPVLSALLGAGGLVGLTIAGYALASDERSFRSNVAFNALLDQREYWHMNLPGVLDGKASSTAKALSILKKIRPLLKRFSAFSRIPVAPFRMKELQQEVIDLTCLLEEGTLSPNPLVFQKIEETSRRFFGVTESVTRRKKVRTPRFLPHIFTPERR